MQAWPDQLADLPRGLTLHTCSADSIACFGVIDRKQPRINRLRCRRTEGRKTAPRPSLMKLFKLLSQG